MKLWQKIALGIGVATVAGSVYAYNKVQKLIKVFEQITISPKNISNLKISLKQISFTTDLLFSNPTNENFDVSGYVATLVRLNFFYNGNYMATAKPIVNEITIPAQNQLLFKNIPIVLSTENLVYQLNDLINFDTNKLTVEAVVKVGNTEYYI